MLVENVGLDAPKFGGIIELDPHVVEYRTDRRLLGDKDGFGLAENLEAFCRIDFLRRIRDESVVSRIAPTGAVGAVPGDEHVEKGIGIWIVPDPARASNAVVEGGEGVQVDLPLLESQVDLHAKVFEPHGLKLDGDVAILLAFVVEEGGKGETLSIRIAGLCQKPA